jgi:hypothetical protein
MYGDIMMEMIKMFMQIGHDDTNVHPIDLPAIPRAGDIIRDTVKIGDKQKIKDLEVSKVMFSPGSSTPTVFVVGPEQQYDPDFGDNRECECGHSYYRHFDSYEDMYPIGCKYCRCRTFKEKS